MNQVFPHISRIGYFCFIFAIFLCKKDKKKNILFIIKFDKSKCKYTFNLINVNRQLTLFWLGFFMNVKWLWRRGGGGKTELICHELEIRHGYATTYVVSNNKEKNFRRKFFAGVRRFFENQQIFSKICSNFNKVLQTL